MKFENYGSVSINIFLVTLVFLVSSCQITESIPVKLGQESVFCIKEGYGQHSSRYRAKKLRQGLEKFAKNSHYDLSSLKFVGNKDILTITNSQTQKDETVITILPGDTNCQGEELEQYPSDELIKKIKRAIEIYQHREIYTPELNKNWLDQLPTTFPKIIGLILNETPTILIKILNIIGLLSVFVGIFLIIRWLSPKGQGTVVIPFTDTTKDKDTYNGKAIADSLVAEINRIHYIQNYINPENDEHIRLQSMNIPTLSERTGKKQDNNRISRSQEDLENNLIEIATVEIGKTRFSVGKLLLFLKRLWPLGGVNKVISGSIQVYGKKTRLVIELTEANQVKSWEVTRKNMKPEFMTEMLRDLAYKVSIYLAPKITASTWEAFKFLTEGIASYHKYQQSESIKYLYQAQNYAEKAIKVKKKYKKIGELFYEIGFAYLKEKKYDLAEKALLASLKIDPFNELYYNALGNILLAKRNFQEAEIQYSISKRINEKFPYAYNGLGNIFAQRGFYDDAKTNYDQAIELKEDFSQAYYNRGSLYLYQWQDPKRYKYAESEYKLAKTHSQGKMFFPYIGLGVTYLFQATKENHSDQKTLLENAAIEMQQGLNLKNDEFDPWWNLGIINIWQNKTKDANSSWREACTILQRENKNPFLIVIAEYLVAISSQTKNKSVDQLIERIEQRVNQAQKREIKQVLEDLELINKSSNEDIKNSKFELNKIITQLNLKIL